MKEYRFQSEMLSYRDPTDDSINTVKKAFSHGLGGHIPRGELWLGADLFKKANLEDDLEGRLTLIERLGQDLLCLPLSDDKSTNRVMGYRYFSLREVEVASKIRTFFLTVVVDGPFQRLTEKEGLMKILAGWKRERHEVAKEFEKERAEVELLIAQCLELSVDSVIIADDLAGEHSLMIDPHDIQNLFSPFYVQAVSEIHRKHSYALFHSCGDITMIIPHLLSYGFDGLAAIQHRSNDLVALKESYGAKLTFMAGIEPEILEATEISMSALKEYERLIRSLTPGGGFIISSCSGLYSGDFLQRVQELYRIADELFTN